MSDELISGHAWQGTFGRACTFRIGPIRCSGLAREHADPGAIEAEHLINAYPHVYQNNNPNDISYCTFTRPLEAFAFEANGPITKRPRVCGYPEAQHERLKASAVVRVADLAQYARPPMPDAARRGITVTLIDAPVDPLGTLAVIGGIYTGVVARSKSEVTDEARRSMLADMQKTVLNGPLESISFTFLVEGVDRAITHQMVRNRFSFFAQESLRFAVAEDWAQEIPLPPALAGLADDAPAVGIWRKALVQAEDSYAALVGSGVPAEEARGLLPHAITTRLYWTVSLRTLLAEAGKRTCTQAQFPWRVLFGGIAKAFRDRGAARSAQWWETNGPGRPMEIDDGWQYTAFAGLLRPVCYQQGHCGFMAKFDRGCTIRARVDAFERQAIPSAQWSRGSETIEPIHDSEWAADPAAARVTEKE